NRAFRLDLDSKEPLRILDLGCGFGVFGVIAKKWGHAYQGLDYWDADDPNCRLFREVFTLLHGGGRIDAGVHRFEPIPASTGAKYDVITAFQIVFHRFNRPDPWGEDEWRFFLKSAAELLSEKGVVLLHFSKPDGSDRFRS